MEDEFMTLVDAAKLIGIPAVTLRKAARKGKLKAEKLGDHIWVVTPKALKEWQNDEAAHRPGRPPKKK